MKYAKKVFKNGLRLITITGLSTSAVTLASYINGGFRFDPKDRPGLSHFTEHIIFNSTRRFLKSSNLVKVVESYGGWRSAFTWIEHQEHMIHLPKQNFEDAVKLGLGNLFDPLTTDLEIEKEKGVIKEEILRNKTDPSRAIWDYAWFPLFFQGTNLARPYSGTTDDILKISKSDVKSFASTYFQTENVVIFVAGNLEQAYIEEIIYRYSNKYKSSYRKKDIVNINPKIKKHIFVHKDNSYYQSSIVIGIRTVSFNSQKKHIFDILQDMLAGYFNAPLIQRLRDEGLIYTWHSFQDNLYDDGGYLLFNVTVAHENVNRVVDVIMQEFKRFVDGEITDHEIEMAKSHLIGSILANTETGQDYIKWYGLQELYKEEVISIEDKINLYKKITKEQVREVAGKYFSANNIFLGIVGIADEFYLSSFFK